MTTVGVEVCRYCPEDAVGRDMLGRWACDHHIEDVADDLASASLPRPRRPNNCVTYFGGYAAAICDGDRRVHIFRDDELATFCGVAARLTYGTPRVVGQRLRVQCEGCFHEAQGVRRDLSDPYVPASTVCRIFNEVDS